MELVPHLPPCLGLWWHPDPHACHQDGGPLQAWLRPTQRLPWPASAYLVPDRHASEAGLLPDAVRQAGEACRHEAVICVHTSVDHVTGSAGGAGPEYIPREERGLIQGHLDNVKVNHSAMNGSQIVNWWGFQRGLTPSSTLRNQIISNISIHFEKYTQRFS